MFSVIIPVYNKSDYIEKAIFSVLNQSFHTFELIIVNDGSTDDSLEVVRRINQSAIHKFKIINQLNQGVSSARNEGVKVSRYGYIAFLDADDWWESTFLEQMSDLIENYFEAGIYASSYFKYKGGKAISAHIGVEDGFEKGLINYCQVYTKGVYMPIWTGATIIKKDVFNNESGFKQNLTVGEDFDLWIRVALKYPVAFLNIPLSYYNQDVDQAQRAVVFNKLYPPLQHFIFNLEFLDQEEFKNQDLKNLLDMLRVYTLERYWLQNAFLTEYKHEIEKVDFSRQPLSIRIKYSLPSYGFWLFEKFKSAINTYFKNRK